MTQEYFLHNCSSALSPENVPGGIKVIALLPRPLIKFGLERSDRQKNLYKKAQSNSPNSAVSPENALEARMEIEFVLRLL